MELSPEFIENSIFTEDFLTYKEYYDQELIDEIITIRIEETSDQESIIRLIKKIKTLRYQEARTGIFDGRNYSGEIYSLRCVIKSLLKGLIATSSVTIFSEITDYKIRWQTYDDQHYWHNKHKVHHNHLYREFKKGGNHGGA
jgi:hypothetical protein